MEINKTELFKNFIDVKNIANLNLLKCYKTLFNKNGIIKNIGSYIIFFVIILHSIDIIIFYINQLNIIINIINDIIYAIKMFKITKSDKKDKNENNNELNKNNNELNENNINNDNENNINNEDENNINNEDENNINNENENNINKEIKNNINNEIKNNINNENGIKNIINNTTGKKIKIIKRNKIMYLKKINKTKKKIIEDKDNKKDNKIPYLKIRDNKSIINYIQIKNENNKEINKNNYINDTNNKTKTKSDKISDKKKTKLIAKINNILKYKDDEINSLNYKLALKHDKRKYCEYYISLLKTKHNFIFSFFGNDDYNSKIIKIDLFFVGFTLYYTVNALFFDDNTMHEIYKAKGSFDLENQIPKILYSSLISAVLNKILKLLALSNDDIIEIKKNKSKKGLKKRKTDLEKKLNIKYILYFIISFTFLLFFWYYIAMFGAIYRNTQLHLLKDTVISFGLSFLYPFIIYLFPGIFRISSLKNSLKKRELLYNFSKVLQLF